MHLKAHQAQWLLFLINLAGPKTTGGISDAHLRVRAIEWGPPSKTVPIFISSAVPLFAVVHHDWAQGLLTLPQKREGWEGPRTLT